MLYIFLFIFVIDISIKSYIKNWFKYVSKEREKSIEVFCSVVGNRPAKENNDKSGLWKWWAWPQIEKLN